MAITAESLKNLKPAQPGETRNPAGKMAGTRDAINKRFLKALAKDFEEHGEKTIAAARIDDPMGYVKVFAALLPKEFTMSRAFDDWSDDDLTALAEQLRAFLGIESHHPDAEQPQSPAPLN